MMTLQGVVSFPGIDQIRSCTYTLAHGITPGVAIVELAPQAHVTAYVGPLTFSYGGTALAFNDFKVDSQSLEYNAAGFVWRLHLLDRRWRWAYGEISGVYNVRRPDGSLDPATEKSAAELARLCLQAMGESLFDVSQLPGGARPTVAWDYDVPAHALAALVEQLGYRVVLGTSGIVALWPNGTGLGLPLDGDVEADSESIDPTEMPDQLAVVCGPSLYQYDLRLEAVGLDTDGVVRPLDELSYRPTDALGGWAAIDLPHCVGIENGAARSLARRTVYRWYRVHEIIGGNVEPRDIHLQPFQLALEQVDDPTAEQPRFVQRRPELFGVWYDPARTATYRNTAESLVPLPSDLPDDERSTRYDQPWAFDPALQLLKFPAPVFQLNPVGNVGGHHLAPAELVLRTAFTLREPDTGALARHTVERSTGQLLGTRPRYLRHDELAWHELAHYDRHYAVSDRVNNNDALDAVCQRWIDLALGEYATRFPQTVAYVGFKWLSPDGAIQQVTWSVDLRGARTRAFRCTDVSPELPGLAERRWWEQAARRDDSTPKYQVPTFDSWLG